MPFFFFFFFFIEIRDGVPGGVSAVMRSVRGAEEDEPAGTDEEDEEEDEDEDEEEDRRRFSRGILL